MSEATWIGQTREVHRALADIGTAAWGDVCLRVDEETLYLMGFNPELGLAGSIELAEIVNSERTEPREIWVNRAQLYSVIGKFSKAAAITVTVSDRSVKVEGESPSGLELSTEILGTIRLDDPMPVPPDFFTLTEALGYWFEAELHGLRWAPMFSCIAHKDARMSSDSFRTVAFDGHDHALYVTDSYRLLRVDAMNPTTTTVEVSAAGIRGLAGVLKPPVSVLAVTHSGIVLASGGTRWFLQDAPRSLGDLGAVKRLFTQEPEPSMRLPVAPAVEAAKYVVVGTTGEQRTIEIMPTATDKIQVRLHSIDGKPVTKLDSKVTIPGESLVPMRPQFNYFFFVDALQVTGQEVVTIRQDGPLKVARIDVEGTDELPTMTVLLMPVVVT